MNKSILLSAGLLIMTAIILGAFGAHALEKVLSPERLSSYEVGVRYQLYTGLALLVFGTGASKLTFQLTWIHRLLLGGTLLFSGSIYLLSFQELMGVSLSFLGPLTPIGGTLLIAGWCVFLVKLFRSK